MSNPARSFKELLFRIKLYLYGIRFYRRDVTPTTEKFREVSFHISADLSEAFGGLAEIGSDYRVTGGRIIKFNFFKEEFVDIVMKRGRIYQESAVGFVVQAEFDEDMPASIRQFDKTCFYFNGRVNDFGRNDEHTAKLLLDVYMDFIILSIENDRTVL